MLTYAIENPFAEKTKRKKKREKEKANTLVSQENNKNSQTCT